MKLERLHIRALPGIRDPFEIGAIDPGFNLVVGPNGSGKSSICRAVRATLWPERRSGYCEIETDWRDDAEKRRLSRVRGSETTWDGEATPSAPPLPPAHLRHCYLLSVRELLREDGADDDAIAREIQRLRAGGYDLPAVREALRQQCPASHGRAERDELQRTDRRIRDLESEAHELESNERRLAELRREIEDAEAAARTAERLGRALQLSSHRRELALVEEQIAALPAGLDRLRAEMRQQLDENDSDLERARARIVEHERAAAVAEQRATESRLDDPVAPPSIAEGRNRQRQLERLEAERTAQRGAWRRSEAEVARARADLGSSAPGAEAANGDGSAPVLDVANLGRLESVIGRRLELAAMRDGNAKLLHAVAASAPEDASDDTDPARLGDAIAALRRWLAVRGGSAGAASGWGHLAVGLAGVLVVAGAILAWSVTPWFIALAGVGVGLVVALTISTRTERGGRERRAGLQHDYAETGLAAPEAWNETGVLARLRTLDGAFAVTRERELRGALRHQLEGERARIDEQAAALGDECRQLVEELGVSTEVGELALVEIARRVKKLRDLQRVCGGARSALDELEKEIATITDELRHLLESHGAEPGDDAASLAAALDDLERRSAQLREARDELERSHRELAAERDHERVLVERRRGIFVEAGLEDGDLPGLDARLRHLDRYREHVTQREGIARDVARLEAELLAEPELLEFPPEDIAERLEITEKQAARRGELRQESSRIALMIDQAQQSSAIQEALAAAHEARRRLSDRREELLMQRAGLFLLDEVASEHEVVGSPPVLRRAQEWFELFTRHRYRLDLRPGESDPERGRGARGQAEFSAFDLREGVTRGLAALSDATRIQLLMAVRLAFAIEAEHEVTLPIFLDESLTTSDPERFAAVADCLLTLIDEGRQVFYLSANPSDQAQWHALLEARGASPPHVIDVAAIRGVQQPRLSVPELAHAVVEPVPDPRGLTVEEYGEALRLPPVDPFRSVDALHLFHLLCDDDRLLELHHRLHRAGIRTIGEWRSFAASAAGERMVDAPSRDELDRRCDIAERALGHWRVGRGRPITPEALQASAALSDHYLQWAIDELSAIGGRADTLLEILARHGRPWAKGFRRHKCEQLEQYLHDQGHLEPGVPLEDDEVAAAVIDRVGEATHDLADAARVRELVLRLCWLFEARRRVISPTS